MPAGWLLTAAGRRKRARTASGTCRRKPETHLLKLRPVVMTAQALRLAGPTPARWREPAAFRLRLLRPYQRASKTFKEIDLRGVADDALFSKIEETVYTEARQDAHNPNSVPEGILREIKGKTDAGHTMNTFVGAPRAWMSRFAPLPARQSYSSAPAAGNAVVTVYVSASRFFVKRRAEIPVPTMT